MGNRYFSDLNYSLGNEDTTFEYELVKALNPSKILSVCGCGGRALPLIVSNPDKLVCVDLALAQLDILKLRMALISKCSFEDYLTFWGFPPFHSEIESNLKRRDIFNTLELPTEIKEYFQNLFEENEWNSILYKGKWERTFQTLSRVVRLFLGKKHKEIFEFNDFKKQLEYLECGFPWLRWNLVLKILGNKSVFDALLYKGDFVKKNVSESYFEYYRSAFNNLFNMGLAKESFFLQLCFLGEIKYQEGNTIEVQKDCYLKMQQNIQQNITKIEANQIDLITALDGSSLYDFVSMSNVPSYFGGNIEKNFLQKARASLSVGAHVVYRSYLRVPEVDASGFQDVTEDFQDLTKKEKVQMYRIKVLKYLG